MGLTLSHERPRFPANQSCQPAIRTHELRHFLNTCTAIFMGAAGRPELAAQRVIWRANLQGLRRYIQCRHPSCTMVPSQVSRRATCLSANYRLRETYEMLLSLCGNPDTRDSGSPTSTYYGYRRLTL